MLSSSVCSLNSVFSWRQFGDTLVTQALQLSPNDTPRYTTQNAENPCRISTFRPCAKRPRRAKPPLVRMRSPVQIWLAAPSPLKSSGFRGFLLYCENLAILRKQPDRIPLCHFLRNGCSLIIGRIITRIEHFGQLVAEVNANCNAK